MGSQNGFKVGADESRIHMFRDDEFVGEGGSERLKCEANGVVGGVQRGSWCGGGVRYVNDFMLCWSGGDKFSIFLE